MPKPVAEQVVVITGASSGIGREAARRFARCGANVVLAARNPEALREVAGEIAGEGGLALAVPADVADWLQVQRVARQAVERFGRIDSWVNNAGVAVYGAFADTTPEEFRRVIDVDLMGQVYGAKAALPHLKQTRGTLIGITSSVGRLPLPLLSAYGAAKNGLMAFYRILRLEQEHGRSGVQVSVIVPAGIDTPFFAHALTHLGVKPSPGRPAYPAGMVADAILYAAENPVREIIAGAPVAAGFLLNRLAPRLLERVLQSYAYTAQRTAEPKSPTDPSALWQPMLDKGSVSGGFPAVPFDPYTWLELHPPVRRALAGLALAGLLALPLAGLLRRR